MTHCNGQLQSQQKTSQLEPSQAGTSENSNIVLNIWIKGPVRSQLVSRYTIAYYSKKKASNTFFPRFSIKRNLMELWKEEKSRDCFLIFLATAGSSGSSARPSPCQDATEANISQPQCQLVVSADLQNAWCRYEQTDVELSSVIPNYHVCVLVKKITLYSEIMTDPVCMKHQ